MGLTDAEIRRIKYELGYGGLSVAAEPYISYVSLFDQVVKPFLTEGAETTTSTPVTAGSSPMPVTLALDAVDGFHSGDRVIVDVDDRQESATVQSLAGSSITVLLSGVHSGTYPVVVESGVTIVRAILRKLQAIGGLGANASSDAIMKALASAGIRKVDEVEFFGEGTTAKDQSRIGQVTELREYWRKELASALGVVRLNGQQGGSSVSVY